MKSAYLLAKSPTFFRDFGDHLTQLDFGNCAEAFNSIKLTAHDGAYFLFYDRLKGGIFEKNEIPKVAMAHGYNCAFLVECRSEVLFCEIVGRSPPNLDLLVCDSDGQLFRPNEVSPETLVL